VKAVTYFCDCIEIYKLKIWNRIPEDKRGNYFRNHLLRTVFQDLQMKGPIFTKEIHLTCLLWVCFVQLNSFEELFVAVKENKNHSLRIQLRVKADEFGILRCYGRY